MDFHQKSNVIDIDYRKSGFLFAGILAGIYILLLIRGEHHPLLLIVTTAVAFSAWFEFWPLRKLVEFLIKIGNIMNGFTNPFLFGLIYVVAVIPTAFVLKALGKDLLRLQYDSTRSTYWEERSTVSSWKNSFRNQF